LAEGLQNALWTPRTQRDVAGAHGDHCRDPSQQMPRV
jgi:hypothetical protein